MDSQDDTRHTELDCVSAIYPELVIENTADDSTIHATIDVAVHPRRPMRVAFGLDPQEQSGLGGKAIAKDRVANTTASLVGQEILDHDDHDDGDGEDTVHTLSYLPSIQVRITLPKTYPRDSPPQVSLSTSPPWLSDDILQEQERAIQTIWEDVGRDMTVYSYIDHVQQAAETAFGHADEDCVWHFSAEHKIAMLDYDLKAIQVAFDQGTFDCGVCLDPKKGSSCHRMADCHHVFCVECLQECYTNAIREGDVAAVRCLAPNCAKERQNKSHRKRPKHISPSELLQIPIEEAMVQRFVKLKHKARLESDKNTIYCPRRWCQGAARSSNPRPDDEDGLDHATSVDEASPQSSKIPSRADLLSICEDCSLAFCSRCYQVWHGEFSICTPKRETGELSAEEQASVEYMRLHTTPCPTCAAPAQKTHGCNHMICFRCNTHYCYLCSAWLEPGNPYKHFNQQTTGCFQRLWELEGGDGDDVGIGYLGLVRGDAPVEAVDILPVPEVPEPELEPEPPAAVAIAVDEAPAPPRPALEREGPLVLRINQGPPAPAPAQAVAAAAAIVVGNHDARAGPAVHRDRRHHHGQHHHAPARGLPQTQNRNVAAPRARRRAPAAAAAVPRGAQRQAAANPYVDPNGNANGNANAAAELQQQQQHQEWIQRFVQMALNDEEHLMAWDSDEDEDAAAWEIPVR